MALCAFDVCDGSGMVFDEETKTAYDCRCRPQVIARSRAKSLSAVIPPLYQRHSFDRSPVKDIEPTTTLNATRRFASKIDANLDAGHGLWFMGGPGTGKTELAMQVTMAALESGRSAARFTLPDLLRRIRSTFDAGNHDSLFSSLVSVDLLHIDDVGAEQTTPWVLEEFYSIVNARYEEQKSIVITTNIMNRPELIDQITERTVSRLTAMCQELSTEGHDHRGDFAEPEDEGPVSMSWAGRSAK